jgi:signal peptidase I
MRGEAAYWHRLQRGGARPAVPPARRSAGALLATAATVLLVLGAAGVVALRATGLEPLTVLTGSMRPALDPGDLVLVRSVRADAVRPGDVITFRSPAHADGRTFTHRLRRTTRLADHRVAMVTQGDANPAPERWAIAADGRVGVVRAVVPAVGSVVRPVGEGPGRGVLLALLTLAGSACALWLIWRPRGAG